MHARLVVRKAFSGWFLIDFYMKWPLVKHQFMYCRLIEQDQQWRLQNLTGLKENKNKFEFFPMKI